MKKLIILFVGILVLASCSKESVAVEETISGIFSQGGVKVSVCHGNAGAIVIGESALDTHIAHGDAVDRDGDGFYDKENPCSEIDCDDTAFSEDNSCVSCTLTDGNIREAVQFWITNQPDAEEKYGHISKWCTSNVTNMSGLFYNETKIFGLDEGLAVFNGDIRNWNVSNVTNMSNMFRIARTFDQDLSGWDVSNVTNMEGMFIAARAFDQDLSGWDVSNVTDMSFMFSFATSFNQDLSGWNVNLVTNCFRFNRETTLNWTAPKPNFTNCDIEL
jgi:surface protein